MAVADWAVQFCTEGDMLVAVELRVSFILKSKTGNRSDKFGALSMPLDFEIRGTERKL